MSPAENPVALLEARGLFFRYPDGTVALRDVSLSVKEGEFLAILGANGSGKTTLLKNLNLLLKPSEGSVFLEGKPLSGEESREVFSRVGLVFQDPHDQLFAPTVGGDVAFGPMNMGCTPREIEERVRLALLQVGMSELAERPIHALSFGQRKRACLAGILAMRPKLMLLDEPTQGLDPMGVRAIMALLKRLNEEQGITMVMATHSVDLVPTFMHRAIILSRGLVLREGTPEEVFCDPLALEGAKLNLPLIGELFSMLQRQDRLPFERLPLTIGEARREIIKLLERQQSHPLASPQEAD